MLFALAGLPAREWRDAVAMLGPSADGLDGDVVAARRV